MGNYTKKLQEFLDGCIIPDKTPIIYKDRVIGCTTGENDCKKPIKAVIYPFEVSVDFCGQDFANGIINVHSLSIKADEESSYEIPFSDTYLCNKEKCKGCEKFGWICDYTKKGHGYYTCSLQNKKVSSAHKTGEMITPTHFLESEIVFREDDE